MGSTHLSQRYRVSDSIAVIKDPESMGMRKAGDFMWAKRLLESG